MTRAWIARAALLSALLTAASCTGPGLEPPGQRGNTQSPRPASDAGPQAHDSGAMPPPTNSPTMPGDPGVEPGGPNEDPDPMDMDAGAP